MVIAAKGVAVERRCRWYMLASVAEGGVEGGMSVAEWSGNATPRHRQNVSSSWHSANTPPAWCLESWKMRQREQISFVGHVGL